MEQKICTSSKGLIKKCIKKWHRSNFIGLSSLRIHIVHQYGNQLRIPTSLRIHDIIDT
jgi:hypothetical protein